MRLRRLDLTRYGKFTDHSLDFGAAPAGHGQGDADFHIIYGPNEAGKSTTMQGWLDLLYGIPAQSRLNFLHPYNAMQVGACIEAGGETVELARTKGRTNTLTDPSGAVLPEAVLQGILGGIDRAGYEAMFSLDDETLELGGESILSSQGDLGQMLFTASSGLAEMGQALDNLRAQATGFFKPGGRSGGLADLKKALAEIEAEIAAQDIGARDFAVLAQQRDQAQAAWDAAEAEQEATVRQLHLVDRQLAALPLVTRLQLITAALADLPDLRPLPQGWAEDLPDLIRDEGLIRVRIEEQAAQMAALQAEHDAAIDDAEMLACGPRMAAAEALKSDYDGAVRDLPTRQAAALAAEARRDDLLRRLGAVGRNPAEVLPSVQVVAALRALMERQSGVVAAQETARTEAEAAQDKHDGLARRIGGDLAASPDLAVLDEVMQSVLHRDPEGTAERALAAQKAARDRWKAQLARLAPWHGMGSDLAGLAVPNVEQVQLWRQDIAGAQQALAQGREASARITDDMARTEAGLRAVTDAGAVTLEIAAEIRAAREALWSSHRASLTVQTAGAFEAAMRRDDQVTAAMAQAQAEARGRAEAQSRLAVLGIEMARAEEAAEAAAGRIAAVRREIAAHLPNGLEPDTAPEEFGDWLRRRETALEAWEALQAAERELEGAEALRQTARDALAAALHSAGQAVQADAPLALLVAQAHVLQNRARDMAALAQAQQEAAADLARRRAAEARAETAMQLWQDEWRDACARIALHDSPPDVATMGEALDLLQELDRVWTEWRGLQDRIAKMQDNRAAFAGAVADLATALGLQEAEPAAQWERLVARRQAAQRGQEQRRDVQGKLAKGAEAARGLRDRLAALEARLTDFRAHLGCADNAALVLAVDQLRQGQDLRGQRNQFARDICEGMGTAQLDAAMAMLDGLDRPALAASRDSLQAAQQRQAQALQELYAARTQAQARIEAVGGDDAVARLQERRQTLLLQIEEEVRGYLRHRLGTVVVDHALQRYRDTHRSAMMQRASDAFRVITRGAYSRLAAQLDGEREVLVAIAAHGASKLARDLSKGTRFQLYLALRVAGFHEIAGARATVPFIADDILETFDDDRAAETFALLAGMAQAGQVIYLTHHRHLCEIARKVCPDVRVHSLD
ncbi:MAG: AAA family ATPase [Rhodobacterales bacterium]